MNIVKRLTALKEKMAAYKIDYYVIPTADFHQSEYVGEHFKARQFMTGFTGSAGTALITKTNAYLWTDGRYFIQAAAQLKDSGVELMKMGEPGVPTMLGFLEGQLKEGEVLGFDGRCVSLGEGRNYENLAKKKKAFISYETDLVEMIWEDRPSLSTKPAWHLDVKYTGEEVSSKLSRIREEMEKEGANAHILTTLDDICWTFNFRGDDIEYFPLVLSYAYITMDEVILYIDETKIDDGMKADFVKNNISVKPYQDIYTDIRKLQDTEVLLLDPGKLNYALYDLIPKNVAKVEKRNPEILMKAIKNETEIENIRQAQLKDSVAHVRFMKWLKENVSKEKITEISASDHLDELREKMGNFIRPSFDPISSYGPHGAIVHYSSTPETDVELKEGGMLLTDTGAGFYEGSTDITRTYALGEIPQNQKDDFTLVAISNLCLANVKFLEGATGMNLDYEARRPFWERNLNFNHGTGHGVGYLLNIHEGPCGFRWQYRNGEIDALKDGMIITDEPGLYIEGSHGIRLENEVLVRKGVKNEYGQFMYLETITYVPFDLDAINPDMMTETEKKYLNEYHKLVFEKVSPMLDEEEKTWLATYTRAI